jgi:hypothetical protein
MIADREEFIRRQVALADFGEFAPERPLCKIRQHRTAGYDDREADKGRLTRSPLI